MEKQKPDISPPNLPLKFLRWFCSPDLLEDVEGDLFELFEERASENPAKARKLFFLDVIQLFRPGIIKNFSFFQIRFTMFQNHIITAFRHALKYKGYTAINLLGLIVGLASSILIFSWVEDEVSMNSGHENEVYQIRRNMYQASGEIQTTGAIPQPLAAVLEKEYPEIDHVTLLSWGMETLFRMDKETSYESGMYASQDFFKVFTFRFLAGNPSTALEDKYSIVLSKSMAERFFGGTKEALGKALLVDERQEFIVSGVVEDENTHSSITFDWIIPADEFIARNDWVESWYNGGFAMYFSLKNGTSIVPVNERIEQEINIHTNNAADERLFTQPLKEIYLYSEFKNGVSVGGRIQYVRILTGIAIFLLLMASINFMNLATARSSRRAKEVGIRKVLGAQKSLISQQFFVESFLLSFISVAIALLLVFLILPYFNQLTGKAISISLADPRILLYILGTTVVVGFLSGSYPAILLPSFGIVPSLKGMIKGTKFNHSFRNSLVVFQFIMAILLIIGTFVVMNQIDYILNKNLGLDKENLIYFDISDEIRGKEEALKNELNAISQVKNVSFTSGNPLRYGRSTSTAVWDGKNPDDVVEINVLLTDPQFFKTMGMELLEGRGFSEELASDSNAFVINEVAARLIGYENPIDQRLGLWGIEGSIIGVVKNFHMNSLYDPIEPVIICNMPGNTSMAFVRVFGDIPTALTEVEKVTKKLSPSYPFRYEFLDQDYAASYQNEMIVGKLVRIFAVISIFISCLGLFGLSSFTADQRSKEIGIRKINGANSWGLVYLLSKNYTKLIIIAFFMAVPLSYYLASKWLENFAFHFNMNVSIFILAGIVAFLIGALTVSFKSFQAASVNPIKTLKDE
ncbi:ABC transporter permease [Flexithrix dorotheae]|uniref:ABC transporter permease n=1 Tax=Flexithrix dorotheae TaxID=70993 RepID=UPI0003744AB2|nr:ABC transporter permease [Flexithrix dorotheae]